MTRITHIFLSGGSQWCSSLVDYFRTSDSAAVRSFNHVFICSAADFVGDANVFHDSRIDFDNGSMLHSLDFLYEYASVSDYIFLYNNRLSTIDRACVRSDVLKKIVWLSFGSDIDVEHESGWTGKTIASKLFHSCILPLFERGARRKMSKVRAICIGSQYDALAIRRDYGDVPLLSYSLMRGMGMGPFAEEHRGGTPKTDKTVRVLVGHHGYPGVHHKEVLKRLLKYKDEDMELYLPMSYGDRNYINEVKDYAQRLFRGKANVIESPMPFDRYVEFISTIDIGIFDTDKNIGAGNLALLNYFGKKIYSRIPGRIAERLGFECIYVYDVSNIGEESFEDFSSASKSAAIQSAYAAAYYSKSSREYNEMKNSMLMERLKEGLK